MAISGDGRRSALPEDFRGDKIEVLADMAVRAKHPALCARLCDLCWLLDRRRTDLGRAAAAAYVSLIEGIQGGELAVSFEKNDPATSRTVRDVLRRALQVGRARSIGGDEPSVMAARQLAADLLMRTLAGDAPVRLYGFADLDLDFEISPPAEVASGIEGYLDVRDGRLDPHTAVSLWHLAARGYHLSGRPDDQHRCQIAAADCFVAEADAMLARGGRAMIAASSLSRAIAELHGVPGAKEKRKQLRHRLVDVQPGILDEMSSFTHPLDLSEPADKVRQILDDLSLTDMLMVLADLERSPDPGTARGCPQEHRRVSAVIPVRSIVPRS